MIEDLKKYKRKMDKNSKRSAGGSLKDRVASGTDYGSESKDNEGNDTSDVTDGDEDQDSLGFLFSRKPLATSS